MKVELSEQEWQQVLSVVADAPWKIANPLLMKIGDQLRVQQKGEMPMGPNGSEAAKHAPTPQ